MANSATFGDHPKNVQMAPKAFSYICYQQQQQCDFVFLGSSCSKKNMNNITNLAKTLHTCHSILLGWIATRRGWDTARILFGLLWPFLIISWHFATHWDDEMHSGGVDSKSIVVHFVTKVSSIITNMPPLGRICHKKSSFQTLEGRS
jgi:hypothetical protein